MTEMYREFYSPNDAELIAESDSRSINNAIEKAAATGCNIVKIPRHNARSNSYAWVLDESILLPDDMTVELDGCRLIQADDCYCNMFRNGSSYTGKGRTLAGEQKNIRIIGRNGAVLDGGRYNGHSEWNTKDGTLINNTTILMTNVNGFTIENIKVRRQRWWGMTFLFCRNGILRNIEFEADFASVGENGERIDVLPGRYRDVYIKNGDGIDIRCGCNNLLIENITGQTEDDTVALTALKGGLEDKFFVEGKDWEIHTVTIKNVVSNVLSGGQLRLLCADGTQVHDVSVDSLMDTAPKRAWQASIFLGYAMEEYVRERLSIRGEMYNISISNVFTNSLRGVLIGCAIDNLSLRNIFCKKDVIYAVTSQNVTSLTNCRIDNVYCAEGSCKDSIFNFCSDTEGGLEISNVYCQETKHVIRNGGSLNIEMTNCRVERITESVATKECLPDRYFF